MNNDNNGIADDPRSGQQSESHKPEDFFEEESESCSLQPENSDGVNEVSIEEVVEEAVAEGDSDRILELVSIAKMSSGIIPLAEDLNQYSPEIQAKIVGWADAQIKANVVDESCRQDKLVSGELNQAKYGQVFSMIVMVLLIIAAVVAVFITNNAWAAAPFLAVQFFTIVGNLIKPIRSRSNTIHEQEK